MEFRDLKAQYRALKAEIDCAVARVMENTAFILGPEVSELEGRLAAFAGVRHCVCCASGTDALELALRAFGVGAGDAVFVPDFTFFATAEAAARVGATPVFVDVDGKTFNLEPAKLSAAVETIRAEGRLRPKAVIPVDLFGQPADYAGIRRVAEQNGLLVVEDAAQGFGGSIRGRRACSFGDAAATSFFPSKPLGCYGDGGAVFTDDDGAAELIRSLQIHGRGADKYDNVRVGCNSRLDTVQAAVLLVKLRALEHYELSEADRAATTYSGCLGEAVGTPFVPEGVVSSWAQYTVLLHGPAERDFLRQFLKQRGVPTGVYYPRPLHAQPAMEVCRRVDIPLDVSTELCGRVLSLPMHPYLDDGTVRQICGLVHEGVGTFSQKGDGR